ncbi:MAG: hypothetical protein KAG93_03875 [Desulfuromusa sp.]|nr:hypothetical protein [Desulfuromusa sp.]
MGEKGNITENLAILDIVSTYPETEVVFKSYDANIGECICCECLFDTVQQVAEKYRLDLSELLKKLNSAAFD